MNPIPPEARDQALRSLLAQVNGSAVRIAPVDLARRIENTPPRQHPTRELIIYCYPIIANLAAHPPEGFAVEEMPGRNFCIEIRRITHAPH